MTTTLTDDQLTALIRAIDPAADVAVAPAESSALVAAVAGPRRHARHAVWAAAAATLVLITLTTWWGGTPSRAVAATPPPLLISGGGGDAAGRLDRLADRLSRSSPAPEGARQGYAAITTQGWYLNSRIDGKVVTSRVVPTTNELVVSMTDGTTWVRTRTDGRDSGWTRVDAGSGEATVGRLPTTRAGMSAYLGKGHPAANGPAERLVAVGDLYRSQVVPPAARAAVLSYLADTVGLLFEGTTTDRAGRPAQVFAVDSDHGGLPTRYRVLVDPATGAVLADEQELTQDAGSLNVRIPAVIDYTLVLRGEYRTDPPS